jgi:hypothetical protein
MTYPRNGEYEIFSTNGKTYCYDDVSMDGHIPTPVGMFEWIMSQDRSLWHGLDGGNPAAFYLTPQLYLLWKLKWI